MSSSDSGSVALLVRGLSSDGPTSAEDSREVLSTISPTNPLEADGSSAPSTPVHGAMAAAETSGSAPSAQQRSAPADSVLDRINRMRSVLDHRISEEWSTAKAAKQQHLQQQKQHAAAQALSSSPSHNLPQSETLRIGFAPPAHSSSPSAQRPSPSASASASAFQQHPLAYQPKPSSSSQLSVLSASSAPRGSADSTAHPPPAPPASSVITGVSVSNAVPAPRSVTPQPSHSPLLSASSALPRRGSSSSLSTAASSSALSSSARSGALPAFLKGGSSVSPAGKPDRTGKRRTVVSDDDEEEAPFLQHEKDGADEERRQEEKRPTHKPNASSTPASIRKSSVASSSANANRLTKLRGKAAAQAKIRNQRGSVGKFGGSSRVPKDEEGEEDDELAEKETQLGGADDSGLHIHVSESGSTSPPLADIDMADDEAAHDLPSPLSLSPRKTPLTGARLSAVSSSPRAQPSPLRSSTPDPGKRRQGKGRLVPLPPSPAAAAGRSPSPAVFSQGSCARLLAWTWTHKEREGDPCEKDQWKGSWGARADDNAAESDDDEDEDEPAERSADAAAIADAASSVISAPPELERRQSLRSFRKQQDELLSSATTPIAAGGAQAAPVDAPGSDSGNEVSADKRGGHGRRSAVTSPAAKPRAIPKKGRKRFVLLDDDDEEEGDAVAVNAATVKEETKAEEPESRTAVEAQLASSIQNARAKRAKVPPVDTSTPIAAAGASSEPLASPLLTPASRARSKRKRAGDGGETPVEARPPVTASPVVSTRSKKVKVEVGEAESAMEVEGAAPSAPASPPPMRRTRSSTSHSTAPPVAPAAPAVEEPTDGRRSRRTAAQQPSAQDSATGKPSLVSPAQDGSSGDTAQPMKLEEDPVHTGAAPTESARIASAPPTQKFKSAVVDDPPMQPVAAPMQLKETAVPDVSGDRRVSASSPSARKGDGREKERPVARESARSPTADQDRDRSRIPRPADVERSRQSSGGASGQSPRERGGERDRRDGSRERERDRPDRDRGRERERDKDYSGGGEGDGDRDRRHSRDRDRDRDRDRGRGKGSDGDSRERREKERPRDRDRDSRRSSREREEERRISTTRPPLSVSSPVDSRSPDSRGRWASQSARDRDRKDRTRSFDETLSRREDRRDSDRQAAQDKDRTPRGRYADPIPDRRQQQPQPQQADRPPEQKERRDSTVAKEDEQYDRRRKDSDQLSSSSQVSPVPHSPASSLPASTSASSPSSSSSSSSSVDDQCQARARTYKHRADSLKSVDTADAKRERAFLYTVAGLLFFLSSYHTMRKPRPSGSAASATSFREHTEFFLSNQKVLGDSQLYLLLQVSMRALAMAALQHALSYVDCKGKSVAKKTVAELRQLSKDRSKDAASLSSSRLIELVHMAESVEMHCTARDQWRTAASLKSMFDQPPPTYGLAEDAVENNTVKAVVSYCRRTLSDFLEKECRTLSMAVDLDAVDVEWKGEK